MTTKVSILEKKIEVLSEQTQAIREQRVKCQERFQAAMTRCFDKYFRGVVSEDITIACTSSAIYFYKKNEQGTYDKEIFSVYLRESWLAEDEKYKEAQLSYYTTSTDSDWELHRLENLGRVAQLLRSFKDDVVKQANELAKIYRAELEMEKFHEREFEIDKQISALRKEIVQLKKDESKKALFSDEGLAIECHMQLKYNFTPRISKIRLINVSKSGKKATAIFTYAHGGYTSSEENVSVERIIDQIVF